MFFLMYISVSSDAVPRAVSPSLQPLTMCLHAMESFTIVRAFEEVFAQFIWAMESGLRCAPMCLHRIPATFPQR